MLACRACSKGHFELVYTDKIQYQFLQPERCLGLQVYWGGVKRKTRGRVYKITAAKKLLLRAHVAFLSCVVTTLVCSVPPPWRVR